ncbi:hypothetical protein H8E88_10475 [candidate division KSB1 bacterium]|nr:hypothetical protein [candidate division KSB1 bacterium]
MKRTFFILLGILLVLIVIIVGVFLYNSRDRHPGYELDLNLPSKASTVPLQLKVGLAKLPITPNVEDTWVDANNNGKYEPKKGDSFVDKNENGKFDAFWIAGFSNNRPAKGVHDDIWARAIVWENANLRVALVVLDAIGVFHDDVITIREMVAEKDWDIDHVIVASTHNHEVPDLMGLWGNKFYKSGVNEKYLKFVQDQTVKAIGMAIENSRPAIIKLSRIDSTASDLVRDSRPPFVLDDAIHIMQFCDVETNIPFGMLLNWGDHPETLASDNLYITSDFCHYWLEGIEKGIFYDGEIKREGVGGIAVFANGAVGGLMTTLGCKVYDPWLDTYFKEASFDKARAHGYRLADLVLNQLEQGEWETVENPTLKLRAKTFLFKLQNKMFRLAGGLGVFHRGFVKLNHLRSEVDLLSIGPAWILTIPGEINPEIVNGGIETPEGADFASDPIEVPPIRQLMKGKYNFVIGLGNDEVGYIMPKTHWDTEAPYTYGSKKGFYGEVNSLGPDAGPTMYQEVKKIIEGF